MQLREITSASSQHSIQKLLNIYETSFPAEERRSTSSLLLLAQNSETPFTLYAIEKDGEEIGLVSLWHLHEAVYIEHFAIDPAFRNSGIGGEVIDSLVEKYADKGIVLEVEPLGSIPIAARRIGFYTRHGFVAHHDFRYIQPSYGPGLPSVELTLMTTKADADLRQLTHDLHTIVYSSHTL